MYLRSPSRLPAHALGSVISRSPGIASSYTLQAARIIINFSRLAMLSPTSQPGAISAARARSGRPGTSSLGRAGDVGTLVGAYRRAEIGQPTQITPGYGAQDLGEGDAGIGRLAFFAEQGVGHSTVGDVSHRPVGGRSGLGRSCFGRRGYHRTSRRDRPPRFADARSGQRLEIGEGICGRWRVSRQGLSRVDQCFDKQLNALLRSVPPMPAGGSPKPRACRRWPDDRAAHSRKRIDRSRSRAADSA